MTFLISMSAMRNDRHHIKPYLMPVRYLKTAQSIPKGARINGFAAGGATTDEKSYHFSDTGSNDCCQGYRRTPDVPKGLA